MVTLPIKSQQLTDVIEIPDKTSDQLYSTAREWFALTFKSANDVIQLNDPVEKKIIGKGLKKTGYYIKKIYVALDMNFTLFVQFKEGKYKYDIQSNDIVTSAGTIMTFESILECTTIEGLSKEYNRQGINPVLISDKQMLKAIESNKALIIILENDLRALVDDLTNTLKTSKKDDNW
jgi:hypothetical protein